MKVGEKIVCPHCHENTIVKQRNVMEGWSCVGQEFYCMMCNKTLVADGEQEAETAPAKNSSRDNLIAFLGGEIKETKVVGFERNEAELRFCKDCKNYIVHPFHSRCSLDNQERNPMDDCDNFNRKE